MTANPKFLSDLLDHIGAESDLIHVHEAIDGRAGNIAGDFYGTDAHQLAGGSAVKILINL